MAGEQPFKQALRKLLFQRFGLRLWPQPPGKLCLRGGDRIECAPVGAADLTGIVPPEGWRLELECKGVDTPETDAQRNWRLWVIEQGGVAVRARWKRGEPFDVAVSRSADDVGKAIELRRLITRP